MGPVWVQPPKVKLKGFFIGVKNFFFFHKSFQLNTVHLLSWLLRSKKLNFSAGLNCLCMLPSVLGRVCDQSELQGADMSVAML